MFAVVFVRCVQEPECRCRLRPES